MKNEKPLILISNDDGYFSKGLRVLVETLKGLGEIIVMAPDGPRSGASAAATVIMMLVPILVFVVSQSNIIETMASSGLKD